MLNQIELIELKKGDPINHFLMIKRFEARSTKAGKDFISLELGDKSVSVAANVWNDVKGFRQLFENGNTGDIVKVAGTLDEYNERPIRLSEPQDNISPQDFLAVSQRDPDEMLDELTNRIEIISNESIKTLLKNIFTGERLEKFMTAPAGKSWHHAYIHGLIEHTLEMIKICDLMCDFHKEINRDLLIAGAMLHDFGKTEELIYDTAFSYSDKGKLIGHIVICAEMIEKEAGKISGFPEELKNLLIHLVLSHQGKLEYASPVVPKTVEAIALYQADELSAKVNAYKNALLTEIQSEGKWTRFINLAQTDLYKHEISTELEEEINKSLFD